MVKMCKLDVQLDPSVIDMDHDAFRRFVVDTCIPPFWEALSQARSAMPYVEPILEEATRGGEVGVSCSADNHGNAGCTVSGSIRW